MPKSADGVRTLGNTNPPHATETPFAQMPPSAPPIQGPTGEPAMSEGERRTKCASLSDEFTTQRMRHDKFTKRERICDRIALAFLSLPVLNAIHSVASDDPQAPARTISKRYLKPSDEEDLKEKTRLVDSAIAYLAFEASLPNLFYGMWIGSRKDNAELRMEKIFAEMQALGCAEDQMPIAAKKPSESKLQETAAEFSALAAVPISAAAGQNHSGALKWAIFTLSALCLIASAPRWLALGVASIAAEKMPPPSDRASRDPI